MGQERGTEQDCKTIGAEATIVQYDQDLAVLGRQNYEDVKGLEGYQEQLSLNQTSLPRCTSSALFQVSS